jgi:hypothetical protein
MATKSKTLITAARKGDLAEARRLVRNGDSPNSRDGDGLTALMWAARLGHHKLAQLLMASGADPNARDTLGQTALHHAVAGKHRRVIHVLVDGQANVNAKDKDACTPFDVAVIADDYETAKELSHLGAKDPPPDLGLISVSQSPAGPKHLPVREAIELLSLRLAELPEHNPWGEKGHLRVTFLIPNSGRKPAFDGIRKGTFSKKRRILEVQAAVPRTLLKKRPAEFLLSSVRKAVDLAEPIFKRTKVKFDANAICDYLDAIGVMRNLEFPDFGG